MHLALQLNICFFNTHPCLACLILLCRNAALDALTFILTQITEAKLPISILPDSPTNLAAPLQRLYLSSEARDKSTLKASLLGVLGLLLQLIERYNPTGQSAISQQGSAGFPASQAAGRVAAGVSGVEVLNRHWLLQMCRGELSDGNGQLSSAKANEGTVEGMTAALCLMQVGRSFQPQWASLVPLSPATQQPFCLAASLSLLLCCYAGVRRNAACNQNEGHTGASA